MDKKDVKILAIVGMCGSGKSTAIDYLIERKIPKIYFGGIIYKAMAEAGIERTEDGESEKKFREEIREKEGKDFVVKRVVKEVKDLIDAGQKRIVLDGLYSWTEYKILRKEFPTEMTVVAIVVPKALRRKRLAERPERPFDAQAAAERDRSEIENLEKGGPIAIADYYIDNSGTIKEFHEDFAKLCKEIGFLNA
jgi:dephospho-CoA kinase